MSRISTIILTALLIFLPYLSVLPSSAGNMQEITGTITLIGKGVIHIRTDAGMLHSINCTQKQVENVSSGYRVVAVEKGNSLKSLEVIGVPVESEPTIIEVKRTVIVN